MPYVKQEQRDNVDPAIDDLVTRINMTAGTGPDGLVNYAITRILFKVFSPLSYFMAVRIAGCLVMVLLEMFRRRFAPYEDKKIAENGDVYD